ncbi:2'-5' RNA ligase [Xylanimonas cellulosilytica DSM 15894]|uniref:RNA 2',3'-cyclic phosphodiesterase n=1 Tax=Xylanimonas cellulosilytica (strain DSM 15894 / JCM 12276 / CECT 5975 / KCTC 9989 / LMG 20990 / NBRC 107835 / XIL07) TaxID=446471 RepID=D1BR96_XYLCX|nr:RNA 2',3'-cyclic phosphodiesterase [Xylanimonas cellulosilytica]ACZ30351.1 2'-5' RNA ligase [Xylanimonas cellulosilytica DSM 15894]
MRLFTAVYPSPEASAHLDLALGAIGGAAVADPGAGLRWIPQEQRHVTVAFHGEVPDGAAPGYVADLEAAVAQIEPFDVVLAGGGSFGGRTLWAGVADGVAGLRALSAAAEEAAATAGFRADDRAGGRPHLTLARVSSSRGLPNRGLSNRGGPRRPVGRSDGAAPLAAWAHALAVYRGPAWTVEAVHVVASVLGAGRSGGPLHDDVAVLALGHGSRE